MVELELKRITTIILNCKKDLASKRFNIESNYNENDETRETIRHWRETLIEIYANSISQKPNETYKVLKNWGQETVNLWVNLKLDLDKAIEEVRFYRSIIGEIIKDKAKEFDFSIDEFYIVISKFDSVVDKAIHWLSVSYSNQYSQRITSAEITAYELSIPIVRITDKIGVIPLIGVLDTQRAQLLMEVSLKSAYNLKLEHLIIDLSGVPIIDTMVAKQIFDVLDSLHLIGITTSLSGIRPEIANTVVSLGIKFNSQTYSSLHLAVNGLI